MARARDLERTTAAVALGLERARELLACVAVKDWLLRGRMRCDAKRVDVCAVGLRTRPPRVEPAGPAWPGSSGKNSLTPREPTVVFSGAGTRWRPEPRLRMDWRRWAV